jgi:hypothetical protein
MYLTVAASTKTCRVIATLQVLSTYKHLSHPIAEVTLPHGANQASVMQLHETEFLLHGQIPTRRHPNILSFKDIFWNVQDDGNMWPVWYT